MLFSSMMVVLAGMFLDTFYPDAVRPDDLILDIVPETEFFVYLGEAVGITQAIISVLILAKHHFKDGPKLLFLAFMLFLIRAFAIILTPLGQIQPPAESFGDTHFIAKYTYKGMYFSGHTGSAFTQYMFFRQYEKNRILRNIQLVFACTQAVCLLAGHSHYSIDVFGALFVAYFVTHFDFVRLVPGRWREASWAPWAVGKDAAQQDEVQQPLRETQAA